MRHLLEPHAKIGRIYLAQEDTSKYTNRVKSGGCKKVSYTEGWIEFLDKNDAKRVAVSLNSKSMGGKKRHNFYRDDIWCMKYLSRFTWNDLMEHRVYQRQMNQKKLQVMISKQKKEDEFFLESVSKKKAIDSMEKNMRKEAAGKPVTKRARPERSLPRQKTAFLGASNTAQTTSAPNSLLLDALAL